MTDSAAAHTWQARVTPRISPSSAARAQHARVAPCVLDLLGDARPEAHTATESAIR